MRGLSDYAQSCNGCGAISSARGLKKYSPPLREGSILQFWIYQMCISNCCWKMSHANLLRSTLIMVSIVYQVAPTLIMVSIVYQVAPTLIMVSIVYQVAATLIMVSIVYQVAPTLIMVSIVYQVAPTLIMVSIVYQVAPTLIMVSIVYQVALGSCIGTSSFSENDGYDLQGIDGVVCYIDDLLIRGRTYEEHLKNLDVVLQRLMQYRVRLRKEKCKFLRPSVHFWGPRIDAEGRHPVENKLQAIKQAPRHKNGTEFRSFWGY